MEKSPAYTFKILLGNEIRRLTITRETSYPQFLRTLGQLCQERLPARAKLTWTDEDGDLITLRTQQDLEECFTFLDATTSKTLRITVGSEEPASVSAAAAPFPTAPTPAAAESSSEQATAGGWKAHPHHGGRRWKGWKGDQEGGWHARQSERLTTKLETKAEQLTKKLERMKTSPDFNPTEFARQVKVLRDSGVEVLPLAEVLIARNIIQANRKAAGGMAGHHGRKWHHHAAAAKEKKEGEGDQVRPCWERKLEMLSEKTRQQLEGFRQQGLPSGPIMGLYLELKGNYAGEGFDADDF